MITTFGSINCDLVVSVERLPRAGETVKGPDYQMFAGGKGANQALAARRAGAEVRFVGAVGRDGFAETALSGLAAGGVNLDGVRTLDGPTGVALIAVDRRGENQIVVASGANARVDAGWVSAGLNVDDVLLTQLEVPIGETVKAVKAAEELGATSILNAAPFAALPADMLRALSILIVNQQEAATLAAQLDLPADPRDFPPALFERFGTRAVFTLGADGAAGFDGYNRIAVTAPAIKPVDTTGAGDAFTGVFAAALDDQKPFRRAMSEGVAAGSLACMETGAQTSLPKRERIEQMADEIGGS